MAITFDSIIKLPTSRKVLILLLILAVILGLYFYLVYLPKSELLNKKTEELAKLEMQVRELRIIAANMKRFQAEAAKLREELKFAMGQLPTSKEIPSLLANISNLGKEAGLEFLLFRPGTEIAKEFYAEIPVEIKVRGNYHDVAVFFDKVGKMPRIVNITSVAMEGAKESKEGWEITTSCQATTFKFLEPKEGEVPKKGPTPAKK